jgi:glucosylceramidase
VATSTSGRSSGASGTSASSGSSGSSAGSSASQTGPSLVVSGPNSYWKTDAQLTQSTGGSVDWAVDAKTTYQRWDGLGGTFNEMGWDALSVISDQIPTAMKLLFDPNDGLHFIYGRLPLGASDYAMSWYTCDDTANDTTMANFSIDRDKQKLIPFIQAALGVQPDIHLWASPWNPPSWMRDSSGNMKSDAQTLTAYALYMSLFVEEYAKVGLTIEAIHPQNEPGYAWAKWPGTLYADFIKTYLGPMFAQRNLTAQIWCGTMSAPEDGTMAATIANDPQAMQYVKGFGMQWNTQDTVAALAPHGPVMQTEHRCGNYPFNAPYWNTSNYNSSKPQNDHAYGEATWELLRDWIVAGVNSYLAWNMVLDTAGKSLSGWPQNALLVVDRTAKTLTETPAYYAFRHFSLVLPGATHIALNGSNGAAPADAGAVDAAANAYEDVNDANAVAFENPDGRIVVEVYNPGSSSTTTTIGVGSAQYQFAVPGHGWATLTVSP